MPAFWTIQHIDKWKEFEATGLLVSDHNFINVGFIPAYNWIINQMKIMRVNKPDTHLYFLFGHGISMA